MHATQEQLRDAKVDLAYRDFCAHLLIPLNECRKANYFLPWRCEHERHIYEKCQYKECVPADPRPVPFPSRNLPPVCARQSPPAHPVHHHPSLIPTPTPPSPQVHDARGAAKGCFGRGTLSGGFVVRPDDPRSPAGRKRVDGWLGERRERGRGDAGRTTSSTAKRRVLYNVALASIDRTLTRRRARRRPLFASRDASAPAPDPPTEDLAASGRVTIRVALGAAKSAFAADDEADFTGVRVPYP